MGCRIVRGSYLMPFAQRCPRCQRRTYSIEDHGHARTYVLRSPCGLFGWVDTEDPELVAYLASPPPTPAQPVPDTDIRRGDRVIVIDNRGRRHEMIAASGVTTEGHPYPVILVRQGNAHRKPIPWPLAYVRKKAIPEETQQGRRRQRAAS